MTTLEVVKETPNIDAMPRADAPAIWEDFKAQAQKLKATAETLQVTSVTQTAEMKLARTTRLTLRTLRIAIENKRKELGDFHLRQTQKINSCAKALKDLIDPLEERLLLQEEFVEREAARIESEKREARTIELTPLMNGVPIACDLGKLKDEEYAAMLQGAKDAQSARIERERKEKEEAEAKSKAEAAERERMRLENERLRREAQEREAKARKEREAAEIERKRVQAEADRVLRESQEKARKEREAIEAKAAAERTELEAKAKAERQAAELAAKNEREAREKVEAQIRAEKQAKEKAEAQRVAAERAAQAAPDKAKIIAYATAIRSLKVPEMAGERGKAAASVISAKGEQFAAWIETKAAELEKAAQ